jgi:hypothetical protein
MEFLSKSILKDDSIANTPLSHMGLCAADLQSIEIGVAHRPRTATAQPATLGKKRSLSVIHELRILGSCNVFNYATILQDRGARTLRKREFHGNTTSQVVVAQDIGTESTLIYRFSHRVID